MKKTKITLYTKRVIFMQRIADRVRSGYLQYISGVTKAERFIDLHEKFRRLYQFDIPRGVRYRTRKNGDAVFSLLTYQNNSDPNSDIHWMLFRTNGKLPLSADEKENWLEAKKQKPKVFEKFELVRQTREGVKVPVWTWQLKPIIYARIRDDIISSVRTKHDDDLTRIITDIKTWPGFSEVRKNIKNLYELINMEWKRARSEKDVMPELPAHIAFTRRVKDKTRTLRKPRVKEKKQNE